MCTCFSVLPCYWDLFFSYRTSVCGEICVSSLLCFACTLSKHLALHPLYSVFSFFLTLLFLSEQIQLSHLSWHAMHSTPYQWTATGSFQCVHISLNWGGQNWTEHPRCVSPGLRRQECHLPQSASCTFDNTALDVVCFLCSLQSCFIASCPPVCTSSWVSPLRCRTWHFQWLSLINFL